MFNNFQKRSHESPMDWEWQTQGPTDPKSPFPQFKGIQGQKPGFDAPQPSSSFVTASSATAPQFRNPSFTTPRKPFDQELFSEVSGAESSPADNADAEDTPETSKQTMTVFKSSHSEKQPLFGRYGAGFLGNSPGHAERRGKYGNAIVNNVRKRKRIDRDYAIVGTRGGSDTESDDERPRSRGQHLHDGKLEAPKQNWFSSLLNGIESRPNLPNILSYYAQLTLNFFLAFLTIYGIWSFWLTIRADVDKASEEAAASVVAEMTSCAQEFVMNRCSDPNKPPAMRIHCEQWDTCMNRDPNAVGRARISAHTFAEIFNSFIEPISYKAMIFVVLIVTLSIAINNLAFGMFRSHKPTHVSNFPSHFSQQPSQFQWGPPPPQTPTHHGGGFDMYGTPFPQIMPSGTPMRSPSKGNRSPSKGEREMGMGMGMGMGSPRKGSRSPSKGDRY